jgi:hypothetical protein
VNSGLASFRSRLALIALALLPALIFRALIPAGFMPMRDPDGRLAIVFCPGASVPASHAGQDPVHAHHHHHGGHATDAQDVCPFALSAGPALAYAVPVHAALTARPDSAPPANYSSIHIAAIARSQSARAPPVPRRV